MVWVRLNKLRFFDAPWFNIEFLTILEFQTQFSETLMYLCSKSDIFYGWEKSRFYATLILFYQNWLARFENATEVLEKVQVGIDLLSINANLTTIPVEPKILLSLLKLKINSLYHENLLLQKFNDMYTQVLTFFLQPLTSWRL